MQHDLSGMLHEWPHEPGRINVRLIEGSDRRPKIQVRLDLGLLQMEVDGRPDGLQPDGHESLLDAYETRIEDALASGEIGDVGIEPVTDLESAAAEAIDPDDVSDLADEDDATSEEADIGSQTSENTSPGVLSPNECRELRDEAAQYYHRYVALLVLEDYERVVRDTTRNLRVIDLCSRHAAAEDDRGALESVRPYVTMMQARALASAALRDNETKAAIHAIDLGLGKLRTHFERIGEPDLFEQAGEADMLRSMREALVPKLPVSQKTELKQRLREALERENYELAAILRDELRLIPD